MGILKFLNGIRISFTLDDAFMLLLLLLLFGIIIYFVLKNIKGKFKVKTFTVSGVSIDLECNDDVKKIANDVWVELSTRKISLPFDEENDVIAEVYDSWYNVFEKFREILKQLKPVSDKDSEKLTNIILNVLNDELRGHLTKWQARFRKWYNENKDKNGDPQEIQKQYPQYLELVSDLKKVNRNMITFTEELNKIRKGD